MDQFNYFTADLPGAPSLTPTAGSLIELLDTTLVNGMGLTLVNQIAITSGVAEIQVAGMPVALEAGLVEVSGAPASHAALNGVHRVEAVGSNSITIHVQGVDDVITNAGMTVRIPPLGWEIAHSDTNRRIYRSLDPRSNGYCLYVDDTEAIYATVNGVLEATSIDAWVPFDGAVTRRWYKAANAWQDGLLWAVCGDARAIYVGVDLYRLNVPAKNYVWGAFVELHASADTYSTVLASHGEINFSGIHGLSTLGSKTPSQMTCAKNGDGSISGNVITGAIPLTSGVSGSFNMGVASLDRLWLVPVSFFSGDQYRGDFPGLKFLPHRLGSDGIAQSLMGAVQRMPNGKRVLFFISAQSVYSRGSLMAISIDDWRA